MHVTVQLAGQAGYDVAVRPPHDDSKQLCFVKSHEGSKLPRAGMAPSAPPGQAKVAAAQVGPTQAARVGPPDDVAADDLYTGEGRLRPG
jgi:hypothetical protein